MHDNSMKLMTYFRDTYLSDKTKSVLDIGSCCYHNQETYRPIFDGYSYVGMDIINGPNVDIVGYNNIPMKYDAVISGQVMEHVARPWEWLRQIVKYSRQYICIIAPFQHREHRYPIDTFRYLPDGMRSLFEYADIHLIESFIDRSDTIGIGSVI